MPKIYLYAEVLTHIRQLTLHASLQADKGEGPEIHISSDKRVVTVVHDGESSSIFLPTQIQGTADVKFEINRKTELSTRIQIDDIESWMEPNDGGIEFPWQASDLSEETTLRCKACEYDLLVPGRIASWRDLPSQDWAEIMDLWYCHKPHGEDDSESQTHAAETKGYSAKSRLISAQGTGMVDITSFVLNPHDCSNIKLSDGENDMWNKLTSVICSGCGRVVGSFSAIDNLVSLSKSNLSVQQAASEDFATFPASVFTCARLLSLTESSPTRKVVVHGIESNIVAPRLTSQAISDLAAALTQHSTDTSVKSTVFSTDNLAGSCSSSSHDRGSKGTGINTTEQSNTQVRATGLLLWIFNPSIYYSSSLHPSAQLSAAGKGVAVLAHRAMKIFYKPLSDPIAHLNSVPDSTIEELRLPSQSDVESLASALKASTDMLPKSVRDFQDWKVGLLDRWEKNETASQVMSENPLARKVMGDKADGRVTRWELPAGYQELYM